MFSTVLKELTSYLDRRFILTVWLPSLLFWMALLGLVVAHVGASAALAWWEHQPTEIQVLFIILALAWIAFFAYLLSAQLGTLLRLYEGYWGSLPGGRWLAKRRKAYYRNELNRLDLGDDADYGRIYLGYPPTAMPEQIMPTRLGNLLKNSELYPKVRYQIDAVLVWPRLYSVLPDHLVQNIGAAKAQMDLMLVISVLGAAFASLGGVIALVFLPWYAFPACLWGGALITWLGYEGALYSALPYAQLIKSAFDLHRGTLLKTIGWEAPTSYGEERRRWRQIGHLWYRGGAEGPEGAKALGYPSPKPKKAGKDEGTKGQRQFWDTILGFLKPEASKATPGSSDQGALSRGLDAREAKAEDRASSSQTDQQNKPDESGPSPIVHLGGWLCGILLIIGLSGAGIAEWRQQTFEQSPPLQSIPVPITTLPAYHLITPSDLTTEAWPIPNLPTDTLTQTISLAGSVSLMPLAAKQPITAGQVVQITDPTLISSTTVIAIEVGPALVFGGQLQPGTIVSAWSGERQILNRLLVLDIKRFEPNGTSESLPRYVVILAAPSGQRGEIIAAAAEGSLSFSFAP